MGDKKKTATRCRFAGPGPGNYLLPPTVGYKDHDFTRLRNPAYSIGIKTKGLTKTAGPGPQYDVGTCNRFGPSGAPAYTMRSKIKPLSRYSAPGPGTYAPEKAPPPNKPPAFSIGGRSNRKWRNDTPGPAAYQLPSCLGPKIPHKWASAAFSIGTKNMPLKPFGSPGPAAYNAPLLDNVKNKLPQYSIAGRNGGVSNKNKSPGPAGYLPMYNASKNPPKFSFGVKHTEFKTACITEEDNK